MIKRIPKEEADKLIGGNGPEAEVLMIGGGRFYLAVNKTADEFELFHKEWQASGHGSTDELPSFPMGEEVSLPEADEEKSERVMLSYEDAVTMLPDGPQIHTFVNPGVGMVVGADWDRDEILELLKTGKPELSGEQATRMGHGIVAWRQPEGKAIFIATVEGLGQ